MKESREGFCRRVRGGHSALRGHSGSKSELNQNLVCIYIRITIRLGLGLRFRNLVYMYVRVRVRLGLGLGLRNLVHMYVRVRVRLGLGLGLRNLVYMYVKVRARFGFAHTLALGWV